AYSVLDIKVSERRERPKAPFITSTLQRVAATVLHFSAKNTMRMAQMLYEAGHITYMRTDSTRLADDAVTACRDWVRGQFSDRYLPAEPRVYKTKAKGAQEAHEAIRPTDVTLTPERLERELGGT